MPKIKEVYEYSNGSWANGTPIGADASNVDVALSDSTSTRDLQTVLGNVSVSDPSMKTQLTGKVNASGGDIKDTVVSVLDPASETDTSEDIDGTDVVVAAGESQTTMWSKFNMFRKRVSNKFSNFLISSVEDVVTPSDTKTYSQAALNSYFADVIGYKTDADVATVGSVADQLSTLNNNVSDLTNKSKPINYTDYHIIAYNGYDTAYNKVLIYGDIVLYSISVNYTSSYAPNQLQDFVDNMPPLYHSKLGITLVCTGAQTFTFGRHRVYPKNSMGCIGNWYCTVTLPANQPMIFYGVYLKIE